MLTKGTEIHGKRRQRLVGQKLTGKVKPRCWDCGSMLRKLDSRWALIQENETDLIFVDENEIIYPKRINVDKEGLVDFFDFSGFQTDARKHQIGNFSDEIKPFCSYSNAAFYRIIGPILWSICSGWFKISYRGGCFIFTRQRQDNPYPCPSYK